MINPLHAYILKPLSWVHKLIITYLIVLYVLNYFIYFSFAEEAFNNNDTQSETVENIKRVGGTKRARSIWETRKRKKKSRRASKMAEVFTTFVDECQSSDVIENDPLCISSDNNTKEKDDLAPQVQNPLTGMCKEENDSLKNDRPNENITLPNHILVTNIPRVGLVYTCEKCARTFLSSQPASLHNCDSQENDDDAM